MKRFAIFPYKKGSASAKFLAEELGCKQIKHQNSHFNRWGHLNWRVINWGSSRCPLAANVLNPSNATSIWGNKLHSFQALSADETINIPMWTTEKSVAKGWLDNNYLVVVRKSLTGHSGYGIMIVSKGEELPDAPLYTLYIKKAREYRVHCMKGLYIRPFFIQSKMKRSDFDGEVNWKIQNHQNGFVYAHKAVEAPVDVINQALTAFHQSGLNFGAVDIIWNKRQKKAYVLEINTAPGLEGETIKRYADAFKLVA